MEILQALTAVAAQVRVYMAPATLLEQQMIATATRTSVQSNEPVQLCPIHGYAVENPVFCRSVW